MGNNTNSTETYTHFGVEVRYAVYNNYRKILKKHGVEYRRLPIPEMNVICYEPNGQRTYAVIRTDNDCEYDYVYATNSVPEDG